MIKEHYLKEELYALVQSDASIFDFIQESSLDGLWYWDLEKPENEWMSPRFWKVLGYDSTKKKHLTSEWQDIISQEDLKLALDNFDKHIKDPNHPYNQVVRYRHKNGTTVTIRCRGLAIRDANGKAIRMLGAHHDLTAELKVKERRIRQTSTILENTVEGILITDDKGYIVDTNDAFTTITGWKKAEVLGKKPNVLSSGWHDKDFYEKMWEAIQYVGKWSGEILDRKKNGEIYPQHIRIGSVKNEFGKIENYVSVFSDLTQEKKSEEALYNLSHYDQLTGLANRRLMHARLDHTLAVNKRSKTLTAMLLMDIDNFKHINESYGHVFGDHVLKAISKRMKELIQREEDTLARVNGDEFAVVITGFQDYSYINSFAKKIMDVFQEPVHIDSQSFHLTISMGISIAPADTSHSSQLIKFADTATHKAKEDGKNTFKFYDENMTAIAFERIVLDNAMNEAIEKNEFELYYQPKFKMKDYSLIGFEALIRWKHPTLGLVTPDRFIPLAEETRFILPLGEFILNKACETIAKWTQEGFFDSKIAVNVSAIQLEYSDFPSILNKVIAHYGISTKNLEIEITESSVMRDPERWIEILEKISKIGVKISIDDFGTGYSSLSYLHKLSIDVLKIDKSFVDNLPHDKDACNIANTIISMAKHMNMDIIAEGIEKKEQYEYLKKHGCEMGQGYLYSKPMDEEQTRLWMLNKA